MLRMTDDGFFRSQIIMVMRENYILCQNTAIIATQKTNLLIATVKQSTLLLLTKFNQSEAKSDSAISVGLCLWFMKSNLFDCLLHVVHLL